MRTSAVIRALKGADVQVAHGLGESLAQAIRRRRDSWMASRLEGLSPEQRAVLAEAAPLLLEVAGR